MEIKLLPDLIITEDNVDFLNVEHLMECIEYLRNLNEYVSAIDIKIENRNHTYIKIWPIFKQPPIVYAHHKETTEALRLAIKLFIIYLKTKNGRTTIQKSSEI